MKNIPFHSAAFLSFAAMAFAFVKLALLQVPTVVFVTCAVTLLLAFFCQLIVGLALANQKTNPPR